MFFLSAAAALSLAGCGWLFSPPPPKLVFGPPVIQGEYGRITVSVVGLPKGMGALGVQFGGFSYPAAKMADVRIKGVNGYLVLAQEFSGGQGGFVVSTISSQGMDTGPVAVIEFRALAPVGAGEIALDETKISMVDVGSSPLDFELAQPVYYAR
jgi:hypothetical protein